MTLPASRTATAAPTLRYARHHQFDRRRMRWEQGFGAEAPTEHAVDLAAAPAGLEPRRAGGADQAEHETGRRSRVRPECGRRPTVGNRRSQTRTAIQEAPRIGLREARQRAWSAVRGRVGVVSGGVTACDDQRARERATPLARAGRRWMGRGRYPVTILRSCLSVPYQARAVTEGVNVQNTQCTRPRWPR
jgi:hypothetical protein